MKSLPMILVVLLAGAVGAASGWVGSRCARCSGAEAQALPVDIKPQAALQPKPAAREAEVAAKLETLERGLDALHQEVAELRSSSARTSAVEPEKAPIDQDALAFAAQHKSAIKAVIEEDRAEQARKAEEERKQRSIDQAQQQADRVAQKVGMNPAQTKQLESFAETQRLRMDEVRSAMQNGSVDPQAMRQTFQDFRSQSETELTKLFGAELAGKVMEEGLGMGMGRGQGAFGGGPGGPGGNAAGGGGRRGRAGAGGGQAPAPVGSGQTDSGPGGGGGGGN
jgi:hypothetical protein